MYPRFGPLSGSLGVAEYSAAILGVSGAQLLPEEATFFAQVQPVGFILFARNIETPNQVRALTSALRDAIGRDAPIFIDQEGGRVQRLRAPHWREWDPPLEFAERAGANAERAMYLRALLIGAEHKALGIDGNCAPLADIARPQTHPFLRNRCYGDQLETVVPRARAVADGLLAAGVHPVLKHIPGHGLGTVDSHLDLPRVAAGADMLTQQDFAVFKALNDLGWGMTAHLVYEVIDPDLPATLSAKMMNVIRDQIGFGGLLMTDDLSMEALPGPIDARAARARAAGCDVILHCNGDLTEMRAVVDQAGALGSKGAARLERAIHACPLPQDLDIAGAEADLQLLLTGMGDV